MRSERPGNHKNSADTFDNLEVNGLGAYKKAKFLCLIRPFVILYVFDGGDLLLWGV